MLNINIKIRLDINTAIPYYIYMQILQYEYYFIVVKVAKTQLFLC